MQVCRCSCAGAGVQFQVCRCRCAGAGVQVQLCRCRCAGAGVQVQECRCRSAGAGVQVQVCRCRCRCAGAGVQVQVCRCRCAGAGVQVQVCRCRCAGAGGQMHVCRKLANVTPILKKGDKQLTKNYRPISLLPICGKMFEKIVFNHLYSYLNVNNLITKNQSGFRPGDSTTNQLLFLVNEIHQAFENPKSLEVRAVFLDISKAFDKVWHDGLIFKLEQNGVSGCLLKFFRSYLKNRKQRVVLNGSCSSYSRIESGVPQGSVLDPLLFLVYINDLECNIKSNINFFADDTMLFSIVKYPIISTNDLNHDLSII